MLNVSHYRSWQKIVNTYTPILSKILNTWIMSEKVNRWIMSKKVNAWIM